MNRRWLVMATWLVAACSSKTGVSETSPLDAVAGDLDAAADVSPATDANTPDGEAGSDDAVAADTTAPVGPDATATGLDVAPIGDTFSGDTAAVDATGPADVADAAAPDAPVAADAALDASEPPDVVSPSDAKECPDRAKMIYIVSQSDQLLQFDPDTLVPKLVGKLTCAGSLGSPFSMGVDRWATAWVLYNGGHLFQVSTLDGSCKATAFAPNQQNFDVFGMAFSADAPGALTEQLFVAGGGSGGFNSGPNKLAVIDLTTFALKPLAKLNPVASGVDLSGNGNGELWGFFTSTKPPSVRQIDKQTATTVSAIPLNGPDFAGISSWAFASWGGDFYLFSRNGLQPSTVVHRLDASGNATKVVPALGYTIVGAGVSSCAPTKPTP